MKKNKRVISISAFKNAAEGLFIFIRTERHAKIHVLATVLVVGLGIYFKLNKIEWAILLLTIAIVFVAEMINSSIEKSCDLIDENINPMIKNIKDIAAGAVLFSSIVAVIIAFILFLPKCM